jgi:hypothetical protein
MVVPACAVASASAIVVWMTRQLGPASLQVIAALLAALACSSSDDDAAPVSPGDGGSGGVLGTGGRSGSGGAGGGVGGAATGGASGSGGAAGSGEDAGNTGGTSTGGTGSGGSAGAAGGSITGGSAGIGGSSGAAGGAATCLEDLDALGVPYTATNARGVVDAVELAGPLNGVLIANGTNSEPASDPMACEFVKTLWRFTELLQERGFDRIGTLGSYCYRCCCAWSSTNFCRGPEDPEPDCSADGYSNHSWGRAVDVRYLYKAGGERYDVNDVGHFVEWTSTGETCSAALAAQQGISRELYGLVCEASAREIFSTILTPNYNAVHRNHFHLDIGRSGPASGFVVRSHGLPKVDVALHGDE